METTMFEPEAVEYPYPDDDEEMSFILKADYPFWRNNGATDILMELLDEIVQTFKLLFEEGRILAKELTAHETDKEYLYCLNMYGNTPDGGKDPRGNFWNLDNRLERFARTATIIAAIDLEASVNEFCFYNLGEVATESIERLSLVGKLEVIHKVLGLTYFKGTSQYAAVRSLVKWRNAFVHGKCTDMPAHSIKENHTDLPKKFLDSMDIVGEALEYIRHYFVVLTHLNTISKHPYTKYKHFYSTFLENHLRTIEEQLNYAKGLELEILDLGGGPA
jgi:hypothetical protein